MCLDVGWAAPKVPLEEVSGGVGLLGYPINVSVPGQVAVDVKAQVFLAVSTSFRLTL